MFSCSCFVNVETGESEAIRLRSREKAGGWAFTRKRCSAPTSPADTQETREAAESPALTSPARRSTGCSSRTPGTFARRQVSPEKRRRCCINFNTLPVIVLAAPATPAWWQRKTFVFFHTICQ